MIPHSGFARPCVALSLVLLLSACGDDSQQLRARLADANAESDALHAANQVTEAHLQAARIAARTAGTRLAEQGQQMARDQRRIKTLKQSEAGLRGALQGARASIARLQGELSGATRALQAAGARNADLARKLGAVSGWLGQRSAHGQSQDVALKSLESKLEQSARERETLRARADGLHEDLQKSIATALRLESDNKSLASSTRTLRKSLASAQDALAKQTAESNRIQDQLTSKLAGAKQQAAELLGSNHQLKARVQAMRDELSAANDEADRFRRAKDYLSQKTELAADEMTDLGARLYALREERNEAARLLMSQREELSGALASSEKAHEVAGARVNALETQVSRLDAAVKVESQRAEGARESAEAARRAKDYLEGKLAGAQEELKGIRDRSRSRVARLEQTLHLSVQEARLLTSRMQEAEAAGARATSRHGELEQSVAELERALAEARRVPVGLNTRIAELESSLAEARRIPGGLNTRIAELQQQLTEARRIPERLNTRIEELEQQLAEARQISTGRNTRIAEMENTITTQARNNSGLAGRLDQAKSRNGEMERSVQELEQRLTEARRITEGLNMRITELETTISAFERNNGDLAGKLEAETRKQAACAAKRTGDEAAMRDLKWGNDTLIGQIEALESKVKELEASSANCELRRTAL